MTIGKTLAHERQATMLGPIVATVHLWHSALYEEKENILFKSHIKREGKKILRRRRRTKTDLKILNFTVKVLN